MTISVITLAFDPILRLGPVAVRWQVIGVAGAILAGILVAGHFAVRSGAQTGLVRLRADDLLYLAIAILPGALVGGRLVHVLDFLAYYQVNPERIVDPSQGSLSLLGAVVGGSCSAAYMASLLDVPVRRWADVASTALLVAIGLGKLAMLLGGEGQGQPATGSWALAFAGPGPWMDPTPARPAVPAQAAEGGWALVGVLVLLVLHAGPVLRHLPGALRQTGTWLADRQALGEPVAPGRLRFGYLYLAALAWWLAGRIGVGFTWRDDPVVGQLNAEQAMAAGVLAAILLWIAWRAIRPGRSGAASREGEAAGGLP